MFHIQRATFIFLALCFGSLLKGQGFIKNWEQNNSLSWDDFQGASSQTGKASHAEFYFGYRPSKEKSKDSIIYRLKAVGYFDKGLSYASEVSRTDSRLKFHQIQFKLLEIHRRQLQQDLDKAKRKTDFDALFRNINATFISLKTNFEREYNQGEQNTILKKWEVKADSLLNTSSMWKKPATTYSPWNFGVHYSFNTSFFDGRANLNFQSNLGGSTGFQVGYKSGFLRLNLRDVSFNENGNQRSSNSFNAFRDLRMDFLLGLRVLSKPHFELSPLLGVSFPFLDDNAPHEFFINSKSKFVFGLEANLVLSRNLFLSSAPTKSKNAYNVVGYKTQLLVSEYPLIDGTSTLLFSVSLGVSFRGGLTR